ncbi:hypothetical protein TW80_15165 [Loktanella sp. S4079]|nr:hypothetical protein TW80_15165 [Loktanella sp. S4079]
MSLTQTDISENKKIGIAVSGGGDSIAMMHLAAAVLPRERLHVVSVNHGLRPEAADELALVKEQTEALGISHQTLYWKWTGEGNLQAAARDGRWNAIRDWAVQHSIRSVLIGHTVDDQAETVLLRLARGSGVDGLAAMTAQDQRDGIQVLRPLLNMSRAELRLWLTENQIAWSDDPSNDDRKYDRVKIRKMFDQLAEVGLSHKRLLQTADHMKAAHRSLQRAAHQFAAQHVVQEGGDLILSPDALELDSEDTPRRVMAAALAWVASQPYKPRFENLCARVAQARAGQKVTLAGCVLIPTSDGGLRIVREPSATKPVTINGQPNVKWDHRWKICGPMVPGTQVRALGDQLSDCEGWRALGIPRDSLLGSPSIWQNDRLIAAPIAGVAEGWTAQIVADFHSRAFGIED